MGSCEAGRDQGVEVKLTWWGIMGVDKNMDSHGFRVSESIGVRGWNTYHISFGTWSTINSNDTLGEERL